jgi:hypothetical protein
MALLERAGARLGHVAAILGLLLIIGNSRTFAGPQSWHVLAVLALAAVIALSGSLWRAAWPGFVVAALLLANRGFFTAWHPIDADFGYIICGIMLGLALLGQGLRHINPRYAYPYEIVGFALLTFAPLPTIGGDAQYRLRRLLCCARNLLADHQQLVLSQPM